MASSDDPSAGTIPLAEERLVVGRRAVETDRVRVRTHVEERPETLSATVQRGVVEVERVPAFREVLTPPPPREEDGVLVISIVEERLVKRSFVIEEVRVRTRAVAETAELRANVRVMHAEVERLPVTEQQEKRDDV